MGQQVSNMRKDVKALQDDLGFFKSPLNRKWVEEMRESNEKKSLPPYTFP